MASEKGAVASGLDAETQATRRRNVPSNSPNGGLVDRVEIDDKKIQKKKVCEYAIPNRRASAGALFQGMMLTLCFYQPEQTFLQFLDEWEFIIAPVIFTFFAFFTRMYKIGLSPIVTWDEAQYEDPSQPYSTPD